VPNGDFEQGQNGDWSESSTNNYALINPESDLLTVIQPRSGSWAAWLGGGDLNTGIAEVSELSQQISLPDRSLILVYYYWIDPGGTCDTDVFELYINSTQVDTKNLCTGTSGWVRAEEDLTSYAGQTVTIRFRVENPVGNKGNLFLDDVSFEWAP
jgi:hypothetical protein